MKYKIGIAIIIFWMLTSIVKKTDVDEFYVEVLTDKPLDNIVIELEHFGQKECNLFSGLFSDLFAGMVPHGGGGGGGASVVRDYKTTMLISSNTKVRYEVPGGLSAGCWFGGIVKSAESWYQVILRHPEIKREEGAFYLNRQDFNSSISRDRQSILKFQEKWLYSLSINTLSERIENCAHNSNHCSVMETVYRGLFSGELTTYLKRISGKNPRIAQLPYTIDRVTLINHYKDVIVNLPQLIDVERLYLLDKLSTYVASDQIVKAQDLIRQRLLDSYAKTLPEPEMVSVPGGNFAMGYLQYSPIHKVSVKPFLMSKYEITIEQWHDCVVTGDCEYPKTAALGEKNKPITNVSWDDVQQYIKWLNKLTGKTYRLPTEAEWEYAARAGNKSADDYLVRIDIVPWEGCCLNNTYTTAIVGLYPANNFGLYDLDGNANEWTQDCWNLKYDDAPDDGSAWLSGDCNSRVVRGYKRNFYRGDKNKFGYSAIRSKSFSGGNILGFRLAMTALLPVTEK